MLSVLYPRLQLHCRPRWFRGNVLASRSKVRGFKPGWGRWIFSGRKNSEHKSSGRDCKLGGSKSEISDLLKNLKPEKIGFWGKFNRHIHALIILKFGVAQQILKRSQCIRQQWPPHQYNRNSSVTWIGQLTIGVQFTDVIRTTKELQEWTQLIEWDDGETWK